MKQRMLPILACTALGLSTLFIPVSQAQRAASHKTKRHHASSAKGVYVCQECKVYFTASAAKKMGYKDGMGHKLAKKTKASKGYTDGSKMKMGDMEHGKM